MNIKTKTHSRIRRILMLFFLLAATGLCPLLAKTPLQPGDPTGRSFLPASGETGLSAWQANQSIRGKVTDASGQPLPGVSIAIKGTAVGTITTGDGSFSLNNVDANAVLVFSFIGMKTQEIPYTGQPTLNVTMAEETIGIEEVVAIGYGAVKKSDLTGAVASVSSEKIRERSYSNVMQSLAGQMPGVQITQASGAPGMAPGIRVRGASSITSGTTPLYVIDGIPIEDATVSGGENGAGDLNYNQNPLNNINPGDIESVQVLKDASSAAIYGSRGANGVVLITTKQGKAGKTKIEATYEYGISEVARQVEMMNAPEFIEYTINARNNTWNTMVATSQADPGSRPLKYTPPPMFFDQVWLDRIGQGTNWQDVLFRTAMTHNLQVSASGGSEKNQFMLSAGYFDSEGVVESTEYKRFNLRVNLRHKLSERFTTGTNIALSRTQSRIVGMAGKSDAVSFALQSDPIFPVVNEVGTYSHRDPNSIWFAFKDYEFQLWHPYIFTKESTNKKIGNNVIASAFLEYNILNGLNLRTNVGVTTDDQIYNDYRNEGQKYGHEQLRPAEAYQTTRFLYNWVWENTLNYNRTFGDHSVTGLLGYTAQKQRVDNGSIRGTNFPNDLVHTINAAGTISSASTTATEWSLLSCLARATYAYQGKYLLSAAIRADGCSRFGENSRWGYFPSASIGWRMSEESFMKNTAGWLDNLKLRVSYGVTGNNQIDNYAAIATLSYDDYVFNGGIDRGLYTGNFSDKNLRWEKTSQINFGVDASLPDQRINLAFDFYHSVTSDMLLNVPIPILTGFPSTLTNIGKMRNRGIELTVNTHNLTGKFKWTTDFNISGNRNKVLKLGPNDAPLIMGNNSCNIITQVGQPIANYYGYILDGVIMSQAELDSGAYPVWKNSEPGDPRVRDVAGPNGSGPDGVVDSNDRTVIGNYQPDFTWGMINTFTWKGFDLSLMITGSHGAEIMNQQARFTKIGRVNRGVYHAVNSYWRSEANPGDGQIFKPRVEENTVQNQCSSYWIEDGSFVRIKNIRLGYTLPKQLTQKTGIPVMKVYVNVENVALFSDYINYDPEASSFQTGIYRGFDYGSYPNPRVWTLGVNVNF